MVAQWVVSLLSSTRVHGFSSRLNLKWEKWKLPIIISKLEKIWNNFFKPFIYINFINILYTILNLLPNGIKMTVGTFQLLWILLEHK